MFQTARGSRTRRSVSGLTAGSARPPGTLTYGLRKYKNALSAEGLGRVLVRWVPSHGKEDSDRISPEDRNGNDQADKLANALAKRIGPTASQGKLYDRRTRQMAAIQSIRLKILTASQASDPPRAQDRAQRGPGAARGRSRGPPRPRKCHHHLRQGGKPQKGQLCAQVPTVLGPWWPWGSPPAVQTQAQMEQGERGQMEAPRGRWPPGRQVQLHPTRWQVALHEVRTPLRTFLRPPHKAVYGGASLPGSNEGHR